ncbi:acyltransferase family protein [Mucilaginibacter sp.]|uniref:acyltransferase family protein n=1 Tax=Mucilaginibacter sp. TaxID=1882438 RepID=UPI0035BBEE62
MQDRHTRKWFYGIDSLRFILALLVMLYHFQNVYALSLKKSVYLPLKVVGVFLANAIDGTSAVIAFFIISGFVIHYPSKKGISSIPQFLVRRFVRILIPLAVIAGIGLGFDHPEKSVTWSLFCELIYYAIYPLLLKIKLSWKVKFIAAWLIAALFIGIVANNDVWAFIRQSNTNYHGYYWQFGIYLTWIAGMPCWLLGVLIAEHIDDLKTTTIRTLIYYRLGVFAASSFCCFAQFHMHLSYVLSMNILALLLYKWLQTEIIYYNTEQPNLILEKMGKFSYSLYICHPVTFLLLRQMIALNGFTYPLFMVLTIGVGYLFYLLVERPSHRLAQSINRKYFNLF